MGGSRLWRDVTNPLARQILDGAFAAVPFKETISRKVDYIDTPGPSILEYRASLRRRLQDSGLAQALVAGQDLLPDIYPVLPQPLRAWELLWKPRSYRQLPALVLRYLDWFLAPTPTVSSELTRPRLRVMWTIVAATSILGLTPLLAWYEGIMLGDPGLVAGVVAAALLALATSFGIDYLNGGKKRAALIEMNAVRVAEFLFYLIDAYSDSTAGEPGFDDLPTSDLASELKVRQHSDSSPRERQ